MEQITADPAVLSSVAGQLSDSALGVRLDATSLCPLDLNWSGPATVAQDGHLDLLRTVAKGLDSL
jgi:hypothetical protein